MAFAIAPEAIASMIACRLDPFPEIRMTSLNFMVDKGVFAVCQHPQFPHTDSEELSKR